MVPFKLFVNELTPLRIEPETRWQRNALRRSFIMPSRSGFTLIELCLAVVIGLLIVTMLIPSVSGLFVEQKLQRTFEEFDTFVRNAQMKSITERRDFVLVFEEGGVSLEPDEPVEEEVGAEFPHLAMPEGADIVLARPVALQKTPLMEWHFWKSGVCEPAIVSYTGPLGTWTVQYDPLSARGTVIEQQPR